MPGFRLELPRGLYEEMIAQALAERPNECCGLLAGVIADGIGRVARRYPLVNASASPTEYLSDGRSLVDAHRSMRKEQIEELAVYHSHPTSPPIPSRKDLERNFYGDAVVHLILSLASDPPLVRGWWLSETDYREAEWTIT